MSNPSIDPSIGLVGVLVYVILIVAVYVWVGLALSRVFQKSGVEGWKAWVPVLNTIVLLQLGGYSGWLVLLGFVPIVNIALAVVLIISYHRINVSFGHGAGMTVLAALLFPVWATVLGFGSSRWVGRETPSQGGPLRAGIPQGPAGFTPAARPVSGPGGAPAGYPPVTPPPGYAAPRPTGAPAFGAPTGYPSAGAPVPPVPGSPAPAPQAGWMPQPPPPRAYGTPPLPSSAPPAPQSAPGSAPVSYTPPPPAPSTPPPASSTPAPSTSAPAAATAPAAPTSASVAPPAMAPASTPSSEADAGSAPPAPVDAQPDGGVPGPLRTRRPALDAADDDDLDGPPAPPAREDDSAWSAPADAHEMTDAVTAAEPGAPGPIAAVPRAEAPADSVPPLPPVTRVPSRTEAPGSEPWAPALSPVPEGEAFPETSGPVSAIAGAPAAGTPRSALASVSALHTRPHVPEDEENLDETVVTRRKRTPWTLVPASGRSVPITSDVLILGRRPVGDPAYPNAQLIAIDDDTRTVSKTHARVELRDGRWVIVDLDSTNGVLLTDAAGAEVEATAGVEADAGERFLLGDAEIRLERSDA